MAAVDLQHQHLQRRWAQEQGLVEERRQQLLVAAGRHSHERGLQASIEHLGAHALHRFAIGDDAFQPLYGRQRLEGGQGGRFRGATNVNDPGPRKQVGCTSASRLNKAVVRKIPLTLCLLIKSAKDETSSRTDGATTTWRPCRRGTQNS